MGGAEVPRVRFRRPITIVCFTLIAFASLNSSLHAQPNLNFKRVTVNWPTVEIYFLVGCNGNPAYNMAKQDLRLYDAGVEIGSFTLWCPDPMVRCAISVALVFDASGSMAGAGNAGAKQAGHAFVDLMDGVLDEAAVIFFSNTVWIEQQMTTIKPMLHTAVDALPASGGTAAWDGIYAGIIELINNGVNQCRALIVMSDGYDASSTRTVAEVISLAIRHRIRVFSIGLGSSVDAVQLEQIALLTGGRYYQTPNATQLGMIYTEISSIIFQGFSECIVTYEPQCADGRMHTVELQLRNFCGGTDVKSKTYLAPLDTTTLGSVSIGLDSVVAPIPGVALVPLRLRDFSSATNLPPFNCDVRFDTSMLQFIGLRSTPATAIDISSILVSPLPDGVHIESTAAAIAAGPVLSELEFQTKDALRTSACAVELEDFRFLAGCYTVVSGNGLVSTLGGQHPSISRWPSGILRLYCAPNDSVDAALEIRNHGGALLQIQQAAIAQPAGSKWRTLKSAAGSVAPGLATHVLLRYSSTSTAVEQYRFVVESNDPVNSTMEIPITVSTIDDGFGRLRSFPLTLDFGQTPAGSAKQLPLAVRNDAVMTADIMREEIVGPDAHAFRVVKSLPPHIGIGVEAEVAIEFTDTTKGDKFASYIVYHSIGQPLSIPLFGWIGDPEPDFSVSPNIDTLIFDPTIVNASRDLSITLLNRGGAALTVTSIGIGGAQASSYHLFGSAPIPLAPGEQRGLMLRFNPRTQGVHSAALTVQTDDPAHPTRTIYLRGNGYISTQPAATLSSNAINFNAIPVGSSSRKAVYISNTGYATLQLSSQTIFLDDSSSYSIVKSAKLSLAPGQGDSIAVSFTPRSPGWHSGTLRIFTNDPAMQEIHVQLLGEGVNAPPSEILLAPQQIEFGSVLIDSNRVLPLIIYNIGGSILQIHSASISGSDSMHFHLRTTIAAAIPPSKADTILIEFKPVSKGTKSAALRIRSNDLTKPDATAALIGIGTEAAPPVLLLNETAIDFGSLAIGQTASNTVQVRNTGGQPLIISEQAITGRDADVFAIVRALPAILQPGAADSAQLRFFAMRSGNALGAFSFKSNDPLRHLVDVALFANVTTTGVRATAPRTGEVRILSAYPNPMTAMAVFQISVPYSGNGTLLVYDGLGRLRKSVDLGELSPGLLTVPMPRADIPPGAYRVVLKAGGQLSAPALLTVY